MKSILDPLRRHTGLTQYEAIAVASIALLMLAGWIGRSVTGSAPTHDVESAQRVIELLDSLVAQTAQSSEQRAESREQRTESSEQRTRSSWQQAPVSGLRSPIFAPLNINTASSRQLEALPGIGPATAQKIIEERNRSPFHHVDELVRVRGIGPAKLERMRPYVTAP